MTADCAHAIEFDASTHVYRVSGSRVMSVTQILEAAGLSDFSGVSPEVLRAAQERGTKVHRACEFFDQNDLDEFSVDPKIAGYVDAWKKFRRESGFVPRKIEQIVYCPEYIYIGTMDREGIYPGLGPVVVDLKTGVESESWRAQLAAYVRALAGKFRCRAYLRLAVQLFSNATYKSHWYQPSEFEQDWARFRWALEQSRNGCGL